MQSEKINKDTIRPLYSELQGYLSNVPDASKTGGYYYDIEIIGQVNSAIDELNKITGNNYDRFKISIKRSSNSDSQWIIIGTYQTKVAGLISRLHGEYFYDEQAPFSGMPSTIINQTQQQNQSVTVQMLLEVQSKIDQNLSKFEEGTKQKKFLQKVKESLSSIKDAVGLISLLTNIAKEFGLSIDDLKSIFG